MPLNTLPELKHVRSVSIICMLDNYEHTCSIEPISSDLRMQKQKRTPKCLSQNPPLVFTLSLSRQVAGKHRARTSIASLKHTHKHNSSHLTSSLVTIAQRSALPACLTYAKAPPCARPDPPANDDVASSWRHWRSLENALGIFLRLRLCVECKHDMIVLFVRKCVCCDHSLLMMSLRMFARNLANSAFSTFSQRSVYTRADSGRLA